MLFRLVTHARSELDQIYAAHCDGYPDVGAPAAEVEAFLARHRSHGPVAPYAGSRGRSVATILRENELARELADFVRARRAAKPGAPDHHLFLDAKLWVESGMHGQPGLAQFALMRPAVTKRPSLLQDAVASFTRLERRIIAAVAAVVVWGAWREFARLGDALPSWSWPLRATSMSP